MKPLSVKMCDSVTLYHGDCLDILPTLEDRSVDAVITDPPYGIGFKYATHDDDPDVYGIFMRDFVKKAQRLVGDGPIFVWQAMLNCNKWHQWFPQDFRLFAACKGFVQYRPTPIQYSWDPIVFWGNPKTNPSVYSKDYHEQRKAPFGKNRERVSHPCPRPLEQVEYIVKIATPENAIIIDPFMGSGTTGVACIKTGRRFIGIEIDQQYFDVAVKRISDTLNQPRLFDNVSQEQSKQECML